MINKDMLAHGTPRFVDSVLVIEAHSLLNVSYIQHRLGRNEVLKSKPI